MRTFISLFIITLFLIGCSKEDKLSNGEIPDQPGNTGEENYNFPEPVNVTSYEQADEYAEQINEVFIDAQMEFAFETFKKIEENNNHARNIVFSPLSTSVAFTMLYNGAEGKTKRTLHNVLHFDELTSEEVNEQYRKLLLSLSRCDADINLGLANSLWISDDLEINERFAAKNKAYLLTPTHQVGFLEPTTLTRMNEWTAGKTFGNIHKLITRDMDDFSAVALDAFSFEGKWTFEFNKAWSDIDSFATPSGGNKMIEYMRSIGRDYTYYMEGPNYNAARLPYGRDKIAMYIVLPNKGTDIKDVLMFLNNDNWKSVNSRFRMLSDYWSFPYNESAVFEIPKFSIDYSVTIEEVLSIQNMLNGNPDFAPITNNGLRKTSFKQKSYIEISEEGLQQEEVAEPGNYWTTPPFFNVNRPFIFIIQDDRSNTILQMGIVRYL